MLGARRRGHDVRVAETLVDVRSRGVAEFDLEPERSKDNQILILEQGGVDFLPIDDDAIGAVQIRNVIALRRLDDDRVMTAQEWVRQFEVVVVAASDHQPFAQWAALDDTAFIADDEQRRTGRPSGGCARLTER